MAARIEALERELDGQHRALHATDEQTGLSYRLILGDLIGLAREGETPSLPSLRYLLGALDPGRLVVLQESCAPVARLRSEEHTSELQSLMRISYAVFCLQKKQTATTTTLD